MAVSKKRKEELVSQYREWLESSRAMVLADYSGLSVSQLDELRAQLRDLGGEFHIVKNTLGKIVFEEAGYPLGDGYFENTTAIGFAFEDAPGLAKTISDFVKEHEFVNIKGGYLGDKIMSADEIRSLADLPPLPIMRARLLGTLMAPASKLARTLAEPGRQIASVIKAYTEQGAETASSS